VSASSEKNDLRKQHSSIRQIIFTSGQNVKLPFLCQYLIFFIYLFFLLIRDSFGLVLLPKNQNLKKIANLKVSGNLKTNRKLLTNAQI